MRNPFYAEGAIYRVVDVRPEARGAAENPDWYEYRVRLCRTADSATVDEWDSYTECFNGKDRLTEQEATEMVAQIAYEVGQGRVHEWFHNLPDGCGKVSPGSDRQTQPDILLEPLAVLRASHALFSLAYADAVEAYEEDTGDRSLLPPAGSILEQWAPQQEPAVLLPIVWHLIGRVQQAWGCPVGLVFHHGGITSLREQGHALGDLLMGCLGHGITLADDYSKHLEQAEAVLKGAFDPAPIDTEGESLRRLAEAAVERARKQQKRTQDRRLAQETA